MKIRATCGAPGGGNGGFTLIELIAVMGIILAISLVVVNGFAGMARSSASLAGARQLYGDFILARQHACNDGKDTYLYPISESEYVICRKVGKVSSNTHTKDSLWRGSLYNHFSDYYSDLSSFQDAHVDPTNPRHMLRVYDLSRSANASGSSANYGVMLSVTNSAANAMGVIEYNLIYAADPVSQKTLDPHVFATGNWYGIGLEPPRKLPKGFVFCGGSFNEFVRFEPTGAVKYGNGGSAEVEIKMEEEAMSGKNKITSVCATDGKVFIKDTYITDGD